MINIWHRAYCNWYDHDRAGHRIRATAWGWVADRLVNIGDRIGWGATDDRAPSASFLVPGPPSVHVGPVDSEPLGEGWQDIGYLTVDDHDYTTEDLVERQPDRFNPPRLTSALAHLFGRHAKACRGRRECKPGGDDRG